MRWQRIGTAPKRPGRRIRIGWFAGPPPEFQPELVKDVIWTEHSGWFDPKTKEGNWTPTHWEAPNRPEPPKE